MICVNCLNFIHKISFPIYLLAVLARDDIFKASSHVLISINKATYCEFSVDVSRFHIIFYFYYFHKKKETQTQNKIPQGRYSCFLRSRVGKHSAHIYLMNISANSKKGEIIMYSSN